MSPEARERSLDELARGLASGSISRGKALRACLVSNRVGLAGAESAPFTRRTASRGPSLRGSFFGFRSVLAKRAFRGVLRVRQRTPKRFNPHPYQTGSKKGGVICPAR